MATPYYSRMWEYPNDAQLHAESSDAEAACRNTPRAFNVVDHPRLSDPQPWPPAALNVSSNLLFGEACQRLRTPSASLRSAHRLCRCYATPCYAELCRSAPDTQSVSAWGNEVAPCDATTCVVAGPGPDTSEALLEQA
ncbi:hypothetical protein ST47_g6786 [Ascochyta rabiei]|uniref:Uncharacterized protein n=1 Tax=Didymella rabiei TaxID=5454 RepID=A0A163BYB9_DIDRA|nr:hypothetical protein ST47_g6786 [Ascochyta rabiei]